MVLTSLAGEGVVLGFIVVVVIGVVVVAVVTGGLVVVGGFGGDLPASFTCGSTSITTFDSPKKSIISQ